MPRIAELIRTKEKFQEYHILFWNQAIGLLENPKNCYFDADVLKADAFGLVFDEDVEVRNICFGCEWAGYHDDDRDDWSVPLCKKCLFDIDDPKSCDCLDGLWDLFEEVLEADDTDQDTDRAIGLAKQIRDFPVKT